MQILYEQSEANSDKAHIEELENELNLYDYLYKTADKHNVKIFSHAIYLYRFYDLTAQAEFFFDCMKKTIENIIPGELVFLEKYDRMANYVNEHFSFPDKSVDLLIKFLNHNQSKLLTSKKDKFFDELTPEDLTSIEEHFQIIFELND